MNLRCLLFGHDIADRYFGFHPWCGRCRRCGKPVTVERDRL